MSDLMDIGGGGYNQAMEQAKSVGPVSMKQRLEYAVKEAEARLADAKRAKEIFEKNPDLEELLNIMQRGRF